MYYLPSGNPDIQLEQLSQILGLLNQCLSLGMPTTPVSTCSNAPVPSPLTVIPLESTLALITARLFQKTPKMPISYLGTLPAPLLGFFPTLPHPVHLLTARRGQKTEEVQVGVGMKSSSLSSRPTNCGLPPPSKICPKAQMWKFPLSKLFFFLNRKDNLGLEPLGKKILSKDLGIRRPEIPMLTSSQPWTKLASEPLCKGTMAPCPSVC